MSNTLDHNDPSGVNQLLGQAEQGHYDKRFLMCTLLIYVAKGDGMISSLESDRMIGLLTSRFAYTASQALEGLSRSIMSLADEKDISQKLSAISKDMSPLEKREIFALMLEVAAVDHVVDAGEVQAILFAGQILGLSRSTMQSQLSKVLDETSQDF